jgi:hypothetical protein
VEVLNFAIANECFELISLSVFMKMEDHNKTFYDDDDTSDREISIAAIA